MKVIDVHAHIVDQDYLDELVHVLDLSTEQTESGQTLLRQGKSTVAWSRDNFFSPEQRIAEMERKGVDLRVLSLSSPSVYDWPVHEQPRAARAINDKMARLCQAYPTRFQGLATLPLGDVRASLSELDRCVDELGLKGLAIGSHVAGKPLNHPDLDPLWKTVNARRLPVVEHPMAHLGAGHMDEFELPLRVGFVYETTTAVARMIYAGIFERYPDFPFIVAHTGGSILGLLERLDNGYRLFPACRQFIDKLPSEYAKRLYYDTCSFYGPAIEMARSIVGIDRLLWGADDPYIGAGPDYVRELGWSEADTAQVLGLNAARIFGL